MQQRAQGGYSVVSAGRLQVVGGACCVCVEACALFWGQGMLGCGQAVLACIRAPIFAAGSMTNTTHTHVVLLKLYTSALTASGR